MAVRHRPNNASREPLSALPKGRHGLSRAAVARNQRARLLAAATEAVSEHGYADLTVQQVIEGAGVSRHTFYEHFSNKQEVVLAAYDHSFARLLEEVGAACAAELDCASGVRESIGRALRLAAAEPATAALITIHAATAGSEGGERVLDSRQRLAALLAEGRPGPAGEPGLPERTLVGAIWITVATQLMAGEPEHLPELGPELAELVLLPYAENIDVPGASPS